MRVGAALETQMKSLARERDTSEILQRLRRIRPDSGRAWGKMTAHQMVCHLTDCCRMALGEKTVKDASKLPQRTIIKWIALYVPLRWPRGIDTTPETNQHIGGTCPSDFSADIAALETQMMRLAARRDYRNWPAHPVFGRMSERAWLRWAYLHTDHHLRQFGE
jgi:hypothetical protein